MERDERYEVNSQGEVVVGTPVTLSTIERKSMIEQLFSINGWKYNVLQEVTSAHLHIKLENENLGFSKTFHLYHGNVRKEDPERNREEKKIQLGIENDPRANLDDGLILGFYVYEKKTELQDAIIVAWPIESEKNYPANPSLRVNMRADISPAKNVGYHIDITTGKRLVAFRPEFIYHYLENYKNLHYPATNIEDTENQQEQENLESSIRFKTGYESDEKFPRNRIFFGAPGTGKSYTLNQEKNKLMAEGGEYERITFHPDYSYASFVGTYKPVPCIDGDGKDAITYKYVPGPFMRTYVKALENSKTREPKPFLLIIEEINRANVAAVFGEVFQLLDRDDDFVSLYPVHATEDIKKFLADELGGSPEKYTDIKIPDNMFIWATMNSADQGVFPIDTAFKRRWDFSYKGINNNENDIKGMYVTLGQGVYSRAIEWNELRKAINDTLSSYKINEDKLLGADFLSRKIVIPKEGTVISTETFIDAFQSKVLMYLFEDAAKQKRSSIFEGCKDKDRTKYSFICDDFEKRGVEIFCKEIRDKFPRTAAETGEATEADE